MRTHREEVLAFLEEEKSAYCDDCLVEELKIKPRGQVNAICNGLAKESTIAKESLVR